MEIGEKSSFFVKREEKNSSDRNYFLQSQTNKFEKHFRFVNNNLFYNDKETKEPTLINNQVKYFIQITDTKVVYLSNGKIMKFDAEKSMEEEEIIPNFSTQLDGSIITKIFRTFGEGIVLLTKDNEKKLNCYLIIDDDFSCIRLPSSFEDQGIAIYSDTCFPFFIIGENNNVLLFKSNSCSDFKIVSLTSLLDKSDEIFQLSISAEEKVLVIQDMNKKLHLFDVKLPDEYFKESKNNSLVTCIPSNKVSSKSKEIVSKSSSSDKIANEAIKRTPSIEKPKLGVSLRVNSDSAINIETEKKSKHLPPPMISAAPNEKSKKAVKIEKKKKEKEKPKIESTSEKKMVFPNYEPEEHVSYNPVIAKFEELKELENGPDFQSIKKIVFEGSVSLGTNIISFNNKSINLYNEDLEKKTTKSIDNNFNSVFTCDDIILAKDDNKIYIFDSFIDEVFSSEVFGIINKVKFFDGTIIAMISHELYIISIKDSSVTKLPINCDICDFDLCDKNTISVCESTNVSLFFIKEMKLVPIVKMPDQIYSCSFVKHNRLLIVSSFIDNHNLLQCTLYDINTHESNITYIKSDDVPSYVTVCSSVNSPVVIISHNKSHTVTVLNVSSIDDFGTYIVSEKFNIKTSNFISNICNNEDFDKIYTLESDNTVTSYEICYASFDCLPNPEFDFADIIDIKKLIKDVPSLIATPVKARIISDGEAEGSVSTPVKARIISDGESLWTPDLNSDIDFDSGEIFDSEDDINEIKETSNVVEEKFEESLIDINTLSFNLDEMSSEENVFETEEKKEQHTIERKEAKHASTTSDEESLIDINTLSFNLDEMSSEENIIEAEDKKEQHISTTTDEESLIDINTLSFNLDEMSSEENVFETEDKKEQHTIERKETKHASTTTDEESLIDINTLSFNLDEMSSEENVIEAGEEKEQNISTTNNEEEDFFEEEGFFEEEEEGYFEEEEDDESYSDDSYNDEEEDLIDSVNVEYLYTNKFSLYDSFVSFNPKDKFMVFSKSNTAFIHQYNPTKSENGESCELNFTLEKSYNHSKTFSFPSASNPLFALVNNREIAMFSTDGEEFATVNLKENSLSRSKKDNVSEIHSIKSCYQNDTVFIHMRHTLYAYSNGAVSRICSIKAFDVANSVAVFVNRDTIKYVDCNTFETIEICKLPECDKVLSVNVTDNRLLTIFSLIGNELYASLLSLERGMFICKVKILEDFDDYDNVRFVSSPDVPFIIVYHPERYFILISNKNDKLHVCTVNFNVDLFKAISPVESMYFDINDAPELRILALNKEKMCAFRVEAILK